MTLHRVLVIPDLHIPFQREEALSFCKKVYKEYQCDTVVQVGDFLDQYAFTRFTRNPDADGAELELRKAKKALKKWYSAFPMVYITLGNHDMRMAKRAVEGGIPHWVLESLHNLLEMPATWVLKDHVEIDNVLYTHGEGYTGDPKKAVSKAGQSVVYGHTHKAGIAHTATRKQRLFGMNVGCLVDENSYAFEYSKKMVERGMLGVGVVIDGEIPLFIPMPLPNKK